MLSLNDLKPGTLFVMEGDPWNVIEAKFVKMAQSTGHLEIKIKNLRSGIVLNRSLKQSDRFQEADIEYQRAAFIYAHRGKYYFSFENNTKQRFELNENQLGENKFYITPGVKIEALKFNGEIIGIKLPVKVDLKVEQAPPWIKGNTASAGQKTVTTQTGLKVQVPPFIETGAVIKVNTSTGQYVERVQK